MIQRLMFSQLLHMVEEGGGALWVSFIRTWILFMRGPPLWSNHLPKASPLNTITPGIMFQQKNFGETQTFSLQYHHILALPGSSSMTLSLTLDLTLLCFRLLFYRLGPSISTNSFLLWGLHELEVNLTHSSCPRMLVLIIVIFMCQDDR